MSNFKMVFTDAGAVTTDISSLDVFKEFGTIEVYNNLTSEQIVEKAPDADMILCSKTKVTREVINKLPNLKFIGLLATGYNNIDLEAASERNIVVCNAGEYSTGAVAQHVFALILHIANKVADYNSEVKRGDWEESETFCMLNYTTMELSNKTLGIFGYGSIGKRVGEIAKAFGMKVIATSRTKKDSDVEYVEFEELLRRSDFITVHCPLTPQTENIFNESAFSKCKKGCIFINTSRGGTVDEEALYNALTNGTLGGAAVDVLKSEPMEKGCKLRDLPNIIITPHIAWSPIETQHRLIDIVYENVKGFLSGQIKNKVN